MKLALKMRDNSRPALKYRKIESWMPFFISSTQNFADDFKTINTKLNEEIKLESGKLQVKINNNPELLNWLTQIIQEELKNKNAQSQKMKMRKMKRRNWIL